MRIIDRIKPILVVKLYSKQKDVVWIKKLEVSKSLNWFFPTRIMISFFFGFSNISTWHFSCLRISNYEYCWAYFGMFIYGFAIIILPFLLIFTLLVRSVEWNEFTICGITFSGLGMLVCYRAGYSLFRVYVQWKQSGENL